MDLEEIFSQLFLRYTPDEEYIRECWQNLKNRYNAKSRYYHNLDHLENLLTDFKEVIGFPDDKKDAVHFAIFYHDYIYIPGRSDNEEKSAEEFMKVIQFTDFDQDLLVHSMILSSQNHLLTGNFIMDTFLDLDMAILGYPTAAYKEYAENIRKEFSHLPNFLFRIARKKFLKELLNRSQIFSTSHFIHKYEIQAQINVMKEYKNPF